MVLPTLACLVGLERSVVLQQLHYLMHHGRHSHAEITKGGETIYWARLTTEQWRDGEAGRLGFLSPSSLGRYFRELEKKGLLRRRQFGKRQRQRSGLRLQRRWRWK